MKLTSETIFAFNKLNYSIMHVEENRSVDMVEYGRALGEIKREVGSSFDLTDAQSLCYMGFFVQHETFSDDESMHAHGGKLYYEDGTLVASSVTLTNVEHWMLDGWRIKATPDKVDFEKLNSMHKENEGSKLVGRSYEDCIERVEEEPNIDWVDDMIDCAYRKNEIWFRKNKGLMTELGAIVDTKSRKTLILWSLALANEVRSKLSAPLFKDSRPRLAIEFSTDWAFGRCKMGQAKSAILRCHKICHEDISEIDSLYCHAIGQGCSVVHTRKHALGLPMYELTAIAKMNWMGDYQGAVLERYKYYVDKLEFCESQVSKYAIWANFIT